MMTKMCQVSSKLLVHHHGTPGQREFPFKLYSLLEQAEKKGYDHIISWQGGGKSFRVHNSKAFTEEILSKCFNQTQYKSFLKQLNIYDFHRIQHGPNKGGYVHQYLTRGKPELCHAIVRVYVPTSKRSRRNKRTVVVKPSTPTSESSTGNNNLRSTQQEGGVQSSPCVVLPPRTFVTDDMIADCTPTPIGAAASVASSVGEIFNCHTYTTSHRDRQSRPISPDLSHKESFAGMDFFPTTVVDTVTNQHEESSSVSLSAVPRGDSIPSFNGNNGHEIEDLFRDIFQPSELELDNPFLPDAPTSKAQDEQASSCWLDYKSRQNTQAFEEEIVGSSSIPPRSHQQYGSIEDVLVQETKNVVALSNDKSLIDWPAASAAGRLLLSSTHESSSMVLPEAPAAAAAAAAVSAAVPPPPLKKDDIGRSEAVFPTKLYRMLEDAHQEGFSHIVSWINGGTAFKVKNIEQFMGQVMTKYFDQTKFPSFRRQLNLYGFTRVNSTVHGTYFFHKSFLQRDPSLLYRIVRPKTTPRRLKR